MTSFDPKIIQARKRLEMGEISQQEFDNIVASEKKANDSLSDVDFDTLFSEMELAPPPTQEEPIVTDSIFDSSLKNDQDEIDENPKNVSLENVILSLIFP